MEAKITAILTDERGWQKPFPLSEGVFWVGSAVGVHIQLPAGKDISPYHLQVVNAHNNPYVRVVNLSKSDVVVQKGLESTLLAPDGLLDIFGPEMIRLGNFTLQFRLEKQNESQPAVVEGKQNLIGLRLVLPDMVLRPNIPLVGVLSLQNLGSQACQFRVELDGLPAECYEISPPPLLFAGGEENTEIRFFHKLWSPPAGKLTVTIRVSAPEVYLNESTTIQQELKVMPYYGQSLSFDLPEVEKVPVPPDSPLPFRQEFEPVLPDIDNLEFHPEKKGNTPPDRGYLGSKPFQVSDSPASPISAAADPAQETNRVPVAAPASAPEPAAVPPKNGGTFAIPAQPGQETLLATVGTPDAVPEPAVAEPVIDQPVPQDEETIVNAPTRRQKRPDLSAVKVMKASSGNFLGKKGDQE